MKCTILDFGGSSAPDPAEEVSTHFAYLRRDGLAWLAWVVWLNTKIVYPQTVTHLNTNPARCRLT